MATKRTPEANRTVRERLRELRSTGQFVMLCLHAALFEPADARLGTGETRRRRPIALAAVDPRPAAQAAQRVIHGARAVDFQVMRVGAVETDRAVGAVDLQPQVAEHHRILGTLCGQVVPAQVLLAFRYGHCARASIDRAIALDPRSALAYLSRGVGNYYLPSAFGGGVDLAIRDFRKALEAAMPKLLTTGAPTRAARAKAILDNMTAKTWKQDRARLLELLPRMTRELDGRDVYAAAGGGKPYVDWARGLDGDSPEARRAMHFEYLLAFRQAAWLLHLANDETGAAKYSARAEAMAAAAHKFLKDENGAYGDRWQTNTIAVLAGAVEGDAQRQAVWSVLARTVAGRKPGDVMTPYYGSYLLGAMAELGHRREALDWMRAYWGGMLDAGATSFWEAWDPDWSSGDPHAQLEADSKVGYNASMAHGWSSGPAAWLMEELLGVKAVQPGFRNVQIRPELAGLEWVRGAVATPLGAVRVEANAKRVVIAIPAGMQATILLPAGEWMRDGVAVKTENVEAGDRVRTVLRQAGKFEFVRR